MKKILLACLVLLFIMPTTNAFSLSYSGITVMADYRVDASGVETKNVTVLFGFSDPLNAGDYATISGGPLSGEFTLGGPNEFFSGYNEFWSKWPEASPSILPDWSNQTYEFRLYDSDDNQYTLDNGPATMTSGVMQWLPVVEPTVTTIGGYTELTWNHLSGYGPIQRYMVDMMNPDSTGPTMLERQIFVGNQASYTASFYTQDLFSLYPEITFRIDSRQFYQVGTEWPLTSRSSLYYTESAGFNYMELGSDLRQYDPSRFPYDTDSIWYNGNQYWFMIAYTGTSGEVPVYPVYLDFPVYSDTNEAPFPLLGRPDYVAYTYQSDWPFFDFDGFKPPGAAWEGKTYTFFIDEIENGVYDVGEAYVEWTIPEGVIRQLDMPIVNISENYNPTISWDPVEFADKYMVRFYDLTDEGFVDWDVTRHSSGLITETSYTYTGDLFKDGKEYAVWVQAREIKPPYRGLFHNRSGYFTTHQAQPVEIEEVLDFCENFVEDGDLVGIGSGKSSDRRLGAFEKMLEKAQILIEEGDTEGACEQLMAAYRKCDGNPKPKDMVSGNAVMDMSYLILHLMVSIECE